MSQRKALLKVASLNTWHGLNGRGKMFFGMLETRSERLARLQRQINCLSALNADLLLLQEVNPLPFRAHWYAEQLNKRCLYVSSNSGVKFGWGPPGNLNEGLALLHPPQWKAEFLGKKRLSGHFRMSPLRISEVGGPFLSLQLHESRVAMAVRLTLPREYQIEEFSGASTVLIGITHLHHAPAFTPRNQQILNEAKQHGLSSDEEKHLIKSFRVANSRRVSEVDTLADWLEQLRRPGETILMGGDFNCEPDSAPLASLSRRGWHDLWRVAQQSEDLDKAATWDPPHNPLAMRSQAFHQPGSDFSKGVAGVLQKADSVARRIDFMFVFPWQHVENATPHTVLGCVGKIQQVERFGFLTGNPLTHEHLNSQNFSELESSPTANAQGPLVQKDLTQPDDRFVSDHYGLVATFQG